MPITAETFNKQQRCNKTYSVQDPLELVVSDVPVDFPLSVGSADDFGGYSGSPPGPIVRAGNGVGKPAGGPPGG